MSINNLAVPPAILVALRMLTAAAERGDECPTNNLLATAMGKSSGSAGASAVAFLETAGIITVKRFMAARVVTILSTGKSTRPVSGTPIGFRGRKRAHWMPSEDEIIAFADALSEIGSVRGAARETGLTEGQAYRIFDRMRGDLGAQAA